MSCLCSLASVLEDCKPIEINEATRWKPKSLDAKIKGEGEDDGSGKLSTEQVLMKANAILNKVRSLTTPTHRLTSTHR